MLIFNTIQNLNVPRAGIEESFLLCFFVHNNPPGM